MLYYLLRYVHGVLAPMAAMHDSTSRLFALFVLVAPPAGDMWRA